MIVGLLLGVLTACEPPAPHEPGVLTVVQEQQASWIRNFNPLITSGGVRWPTRSGVYEPLMIFNGAQERWEPWLAESYAWSEDDTSVTFRIREGVRWSDGTPMGADDVVFTFGLLLERPELDTKGLSGFVKGVEATGPHSVRIQLKRPYSPGLTDLAHQVIVPEHIWSAIDNPTVFTNPDPVGTGPFTEVETFNAQVFELGRNPHYWQPIEVEAMRFPALGSNDQVNLALINGEIDWAGTFVPAIDRVYVGRDPDHHHYWFPLTGATIFLYPNHSRPPFDDVRVRKALSLAIDRELLVKVAMYDYTRPADITGLSDSHASWRSEDVHGDWVTTDVDRANALLDEAGLVRGPDGKRRGPDGEVLTLELSAITGWSDWVRAAQVIRTDLEAVGLDVRMKSYDFSAWYERLGRGDFDLTIGWSERGPTPYHLYQGLMSTRTVAPIGETALRNWHRAESSEMDQLLEAFESTNDAAQQRQIVARMQQLFVEEAPAIPLFPSPAWGQYNTARFTGFPSAEDPYASLSVNDEPSPLLVMTRLRLVRDTMASADP